MVRRIAWTADGQGDVLHRLQRRRPEDEPEVQGADPEGPATVHEDCDEGEVTRKEDVRERRDRRGVNQHGT